MSRMLGLCLFAILLSCSFALRLNSMRSTRVRDTARMAFMFKKGMGTLQDLNCIGEKGEFYYHPSKAPKVVLPKDASIDTARVVGKTKSVSIFPYSSILVPSGSEWLNVFEFKHRQLLNDLPEGGLFGFSYYSTNTQKLALVGTLARIKSRKMLDDGRAFVIIEGVSRFYLEEFTAEKPYLRAKVRELKDYTESTTEHLDALEVQIFNELRTNTRLMTHLFPAKNYKISDAILQNRPSSLVTGKAHSRAVVLADEEEELDRRSRFSYAVLDMLQINSSLKLSLMQEHQIEKRLQGFLETLESGKTFLLNELEKKGHPADDIEAMLAECVESNAKSLDSELLDGHSEAWEATNFENGQWTQGVCLM